ncbi:ABC transporter substrate-binding protein [Caenimonas soli]|uniref:ABC transporter substrate-binding protein n=1 Tax=Caenimonas soli TaxID=2735555 RepID=UPI0015529AD5|nr:ABC transporter substrate-binding protein [Caenimonas soli]NPC57916.1 ABC transporter substrate-binding protein [Caenimonas soli]
MTLLYKLARTAAAVTMALIAGTASAQAASNAEPIKIGFTSATKTLLGSQMLKGAQYATTQLNAAGGVLGRKVELVVYDTALNPAEGSNVAQRLVTENKVKFVAGEVSSTVAFAMIPTFKRAGVLYMAGIPKHPDVTTKGYDRLFRLNSTTEMDARALKPVLIARFPGKKVALFNENTDFGLDGRKHLKAIFNEPGQIVFDETYDISQSDFNAVVTNMRRSKADVLCITGTNPEHYGNVIRMAAEIGFKPSICLMPGILYPGALKITGPAAEGAVSADIYVPSLDNPVNKAFVEGYKKAHGDEPDKSVAIGYESITLLAAAMIAAKTAEDPGKVAEVLKAGTWQTPRGGVRFAQDGQANGAYALLTVRDGRIAVSK